MNNAIHRCLIAVALLLIVVGGAEAAPAYPIVRNLVLTDDTEVADAMLMGDEVYHYWQTPDGRMFQEVSEGVFTQMIPNDDRLQAPRLGITAPRIRQQVPNLAPRGLVILVNFQDVRFAEANSPQAIDSMLNADTYTYNGAYGSARNYFRDQSHGAYVPTFDVVGPVEMPENASYYGSNILGGQDRYVGEMTLEACRQVALMPEIDFADYDYDQDGVIDLVYIIYAGNGEADGGASNTIWPAKWNMISAIQSGNTLLDTDAWLDQSMYSFGGKIVMDFAYSPECVSGSMRRSGIGTFCHEFSHVLGLSDLYDIYYHDNYLRRRTPGGWTLMDKGLYNKQGNLPPNMTVYDKYFLGWATPELLHQTTNVIMPADGETYFYLTADGFPALPTDTQTVFYIENRQQTGWDEGLPGHGMLIWKVTYDSLKWADNEVNSEPAVLNYTLASATGWTGNLGEAYDAFPGTKNVTSCSLVEAYPISDIVEDEQVITFFVAGDVSALYDMKAISPDDYQAIYTITGQPLLLPWHLLPQGIYLVTYEHAGEKLTKKLIK